MRDLRSRALITALLPFAAGACRVADASQLDFTDVETELLAEWPDVGEARLRAAGDGALLVTTDTGRFRVDPTVGDPTWELEPVAGGLAPDERRPEPPDGVADAIPRITDVTFDAHGFAWVAHVGGLEVFDSGGARIAHVLDGVVEAIAFGGESGRTLFFTRRSPRGIQLHRAFVGVRGF